MFRARAVLASRHTIRIGEFETLQQAYDVAVQISKMNKLIDKENKEANETFIDELDQITGAYIEKLKL